MISIGNYILDRYRLSDLYSAAPCLFCQPVIKLIAADHAQRMTFGHADIQSHGFKIKVDLIRVYMRDFTDVEPKALQNDLRVDHKTARAKLRARVARFFQDQDVAC